MKELAQKISNKLVESGWQKQLWMFLQSSDFLDILEQLKYKVDIEKQRFCPSLKDAFSFLELCPIDKIKAIIIVDYVDNKIHKDNIVPLMFKYQEENNKLVREVHRTLHDKKIKASRSIDWIQQGVLIIPLALTSRLDGKAHKKLWEPFIMRLIEVLNKKCFNVPWYLLGNDTFKYEEDILSTYIRKGDTRLVFNDYEWFNWINSIIIKHKKEPIDWYKIHEASTETKEPVE